MKKTIKIVLAVLVVITIAVAAIAQMNAPIQVPLTQIVARTATLSFKEQGVVAASKMMHVYPVVQGEITDVRVKEGDMIKKGDVICVIDSKGQRLRIEQINSMIRGYQAQKDNLDVEQDKLRSQLESSKTELEGQRVILEGRQKDDNMPTTTVAEQADLQRLIIEQAGAQVNRAQDNIKLLTDIQDVALKQAREQEAIAQEQLAKAENLYESGVVPRREYESAQEALKAAQTAIEQIQAQSAQEQTAAQNAVVAAQEALEQQKQQLAVILSGERPVAQEYYNASKRALAMQMSEVDKALGRDDFGAMRRYYDSLIEGCKVDIETINSEIEKCTIRAAATGKITKLDAENTNTANPAVSLATITVEGDNIIETYISTNNVDSVKVGDRVGLVLKRQGGDVEFDGEVRKIEGMAEVKLSALGVEERRVKVELTAKEDAHGDAVFGIGFDVTAEFFVYREENQLIVPKTALWEEDGKDMIWLANEAVAQKIEVVKGRELRTETVILSGVSDGDYIITDADNPQLKDGVKIEGE